MKAITLWQPWASLLACGAKQYETRSWATSYRGPIAIHAAAKPVLPSFQWMVERDARLAIIKALADNGQGLLRRLPRGCIIATAELVWCWEIHANDPNSGGEPYPYILPYRNFERRYIYGNELLFGDWTPGRFAWEFANVKILDKPIPAKGAQRIWNWEPPDTQEGADQ